MLNQLVHRIWLISKCHEWWSCSIQEPMIYVNHIMMGCWKWYQSYHRCSSVWTPTEGSDPKPSKRISILERSKNGQINKHNFLDENKFMIVFESTSLSLSASLICCAMNRTPRRACNTSGVSLRGNIFSDSVSAKKQHKWGY